MDESDGRTTVTVRSGRAEVSTDNEVYAVNARQSIVLGDGSPYILQSARRRDAPGYGQAWYPRANANWSPYRFGRWAWIDPWGWSWIDDEPWGFAPSH